MSKPVFHVKIYSPFKVYYDAAAQSISAENDTGPFDILPRHKNFLTLLRPCNIKVVQEDGQVLEFPVAQGIMQVKAVETTVFLDV